MQTIEPSRRRLPRRILQAACASFVGGAACFGAFAVIGSTVDENGILHEPFFLVPTGWLLVLLGCVLGMTAALLTFVQIFRERRLREKHAAEESSIDAR